MATDTKQGQNAVTATTSTNSVVRYVSAFGDVELSTQTVRNYLVRGNVAVSDQEVMLFMELCKFQRLNPFTNEVYLIKFGSDPAQMVVGRDAYLRRAYENPDYLGYESGITVMRGEQVVQKPGTCVYPGEKVLGGWCRVKRKLNGIEVETFKEVSLDEYNLKRSNWNTKPGLMISKVAESQALRAAFPTDYAGMYTAEEAGPGNNPDVYDISPQDVTSDVDPIITQEQRQELFKKAKEKFGEAANDSVSRIIAEFGFNSTANMPISVWKEVMARIDEWKERVLGVEDDDVSEGEDVSQ